MNGFGSAFKLTTNSWTLGRLRQEDRESEASTRDPVSRKKKTNKQTIECELGGFLPGDDLSMGTVRVAWVSRK
jgi:hypothetical protein